MPLYILATPLFCITQSALHSCAQPQPPHFSHLYSLYLLLLNKKFPPLAFHLSLSLSSFRTFLQLRTAHFAFSLHRSFSLLHTHPRTTPHPLIATSEPRGFALRYRIVRISASQLRPWHINVIQSNKGYECFGNNSMVSHPSGSDTSSSRDMFPSLDDGLFQQVGSMGSTVQLEI